MSTFLFAAIVITLSCYAVAMGLTLYRMLKGPRAQDRVLAMDLMYTIGMLMLMVLAIRYQSEMYFEAALLIALFGFVSSAAMAKFLLRGGGNRMMAAAPFWVEVLVGVLLIVSGVFTLSSAVGIVRFNSFFQRMHPTALAYSFSAWIVTLASIVYFSAVETSVTVHPWLIIVFLSITVPVTTIFLARTNLFRNRISKEPETEVPPPLSEVASPMPKKKPAHLD